MPTQIHSPSKNPTPFSPCTVTSNLMPMFEMSSISSEWTENQPGTSTSTIPCSGTLLHPLPWPRCWLVFPLLPFFPFPVLLQDLRSACSAPIFMRLEHFPASGEGLLKDTLPPSLSQAPRQLAVPTFCGYSNTRVLLRVGTSP